jgi:LmbE family N-acetylglucosaminyl deacetylase
MTWIDALHAAARGGRCLHRDEAPLVGAGRVLALAPHPDDPDAMAVTLRLLAAGGWQMHWTVLTSSWSGVEDAFVGPDPATKAAARREEQRASARLFGLPDDRLVFLDLDEGDDGHLAPTAENRARYTAHLDALAPDVVVLPSRLDTNPTHALNYAWCAEWAAGAGRPVLLLGNEDPKTTAFRPDLQVTFGAEMAAWKGALLECHASQSARNRHTRGMTFADRILRVNAAVPGLAPGAYAERFTAEWWG